MTPKNSSHLLSAPADEPLLTKQVCQKCAFEMTWDGWLKCPRCGGMLPKQPVEVTEKAAEPCRECNGTGRMPPWPGSNGLVDCKLCGFPPAAPPVAEEGAAELEKEQVRWQKAIYELLVKETDCTIDGGGCDSGDPLDFTLSEISQAIGILKEENRYVLNDALTWRNRAISAEEEIRENGRGIDLRRGFER